LGVLQINVYVIVDINEESRSLNERLSHYIAWVIWVQSMSRTYGAPMNAEYLFSTNV